MSMKLYFDLMSQPARAVYMFLRKTNIPFEPKRIDLKKGQHFSDEYKTNVNPFGLVPVIDDNGFKLTESVAILRYLSREKGVADHWYPKDSKLQARIDEYLEWQHLNTRANCAMYFRVKFLMPLMTGKPPTEKDLNKWMKSMNETLDKIENIWLKDTPFLNSHQISIADILGACEIEQPRMAGFDPFANRPVLAAWMDRVKKEIGPSYEEAHKVVRLVMSKYDGDSSNSSFREGGAKL
ncbi:glutathione S-transferase theta-1-like isoform X2 [Neocloeon triangulifer]|uniref:glutathione S-transferase theta-1-like isoform X2 n=1 Tax=Neocloeon triangulifer TaxID=2078957 RepID=UPI00286F4F53|nr:glutathione S-transferase theta-1-like isoform X2 [Neocloeon triangulifer]